jgi:hypothetical protein
MLFYLDCVTLTALTVVAPNPSSVSLGPTGRASPPAVSPAHASTAATVPFARVCVPQEGVGSCRGGGRVVIGSTVSGYVGGGGGGR